MTFNMNANGYSVTTPAGTEEVDRAEFFARLRRQVVAMSK